MLGAFLALAGLGLAPLVPAGPAAAQAGGAPAFATYRVFATQYNPTTAGSVEVAVPDKCAKFAALRLTSALSSASCPAGYALDLDYRVTVTLDNGRSAAFPVKDVGPWNVDDNYWDGVSGSAPRPRRLFTNLPTGTPEAQAAFQNGYNTVANCKDLDQNPTTKTAGADQFGRCVLNPAGLDLSVAAAAQLGLGSLENAWVTVSFMWEPANTTYVPLTPARVLDTRNGTGAPAGRVGAGRTVDVAVTGVGGVPPAGVSAVVLNVTATDYIGPADFVTVFPAGAPRPLASSLNITQGTTVPNLVVARVGAGGKVSIYNNLGSVNLVADVQGYYASSTTAGSRYQPLVPSRVLDTRDGTGGYSAKVTGGSTIDLTIVGAGGVPASGVTAVALNVTATDVSGPDTFVTVFPSGGSQPLASNLNAVTGQTVPNLVIVRVGDGGRISFYNNIGTVDLVADVQGWYGSGAGSTYVPVAPIRALDTRYGTGAPAGSVGPGGVQELQVSGVNGVPTSSVTAIAFNVTVTEPTGPDSFLTAYPSGTSLPLASNLNYVAGQTVANAAFVRLGSNGRVSFYNNLGRVQVIADLQGWFTTS